MPPRRSTRAAPAQLVQVAQELPSVDSDVLALRRNWKWAAFSQFFHTFSSLFNMPDVSISDIEEDLVQTSTLHLPRIMARLLVVLTQDRKTTVSNWQVTLRRQYARRNPALDPLAPIPAAPSSRSSSTSDEGPPPLPPSSASPTESGPEEPRMKEDREASLSRQTSALPEPGCEDLRPQDWTDLPTSTKLDCLHLLTEWQFQNVSRFRQTMKSDDEHADWRIEPIGYDTHSNAYWLIGGKRCDLRCAFMTDPDEEHRLWIQRASLIKHSSRKRKRSDPRDEEISQRKQQSHTTSRSVKKQAASVMPSTGRMSRSQSTPSSTRAAKLKAQSQLSKQAKELARYNASLTPRGTRISARLRGMDDDVGEWQPVPNEWLEPSSRSARRKATRKLSPPTRSATESSEESELTDLSSEDEADMPASETRHDELQKPDDESTGQTGIRAPIEDVPELSIDFIEWETIAVTLDEWEHIADQFQNATHHREKALHKLLTTSIVPSVVQYLGDVEKKRHLEEVVSSRKRSNRLAGKEAEREAARLLEQQKVEEAKELARAQRAAAREHRDTQDRERRDLAREQRRLDREKREAEAKAREEADEHAVDGVIDVETTEDDISAAVDPKPVRIRSTKAMRSTSAPRKLIAHEPRHLSNLHQSRELDCEVCKMRGTVMSHDSINPIVVCRVCSRAQHSRCWEQVDQSNVHPFRNWAHAGFACYRCQPPAPVNNGYIPYGHTGHSSSSSYSGPMHHLPPLQPPSAVSPILPSFGNHNTVAYTPHAYSHSQSIPVASYGVSTMQHPSTSVPTYSPPGYMHSTYNTQQTTFSPHNYPSFAGGAPPTSATSSLRHSTSGYHQHDQRWNGHVHPPQAPSVPQTSQYNSHYVHHPGS